MRTLGQIVGRIKRCNPKTESDLLKDCGLPLRYLGSGLYRDVFEVVNSGYIVKLPLQKSNGEVRNDCIEHSTTEHRAYLRIVRSKKRFAPLHPYMPKVRYFNGKTGVMVMDKYQTRQAMRQTRQALRYDRVNVERLASKLFGDAEIDLHSENIGFDSNGQLKIIDLGYFG